MRFLSKFNRTSRRRTYESLESRILLTGVVINEIHFDPDIKAEQVEFIELYNSGPDAVDVSGWRIDSAVDFEFAADTLFAANDYLVITQNAEDFRTKYGITAFGEWQVGDKLDNDGERIELLDKEGNVVDEVRYALGFPWPVVGDKGESIELIHPGFDNNLPGNWSSSITSESGSLVTENATWNYRKGLSNNPPDAWNEVDFDTSTDNVPWQEGQATLGYGDNDDETILSFAIDAEMTDALLLRLYIDDGAIIYINGTEVARSHVSGGTKDFNSSGSNHEAAWEEIQLTGLSNVLIPGNNVLAIHGLNQSTGSSDFSFNAELTIGANRSRYTGAREFIVRPQRCTES